MKNPRYSIQIFYIDNGEHEYYYAFHPELGHSACSDTGETAQEAVDNLKGTLETVLDHFKRKGHPIPEPHPYPFDR